MALKAKHPHIRIDELIWDDPVVLGLSLHTFRTYIFAIAWSKSQGGRTPDGLLTDHGIGRIGATPADLDELQKAALFEKCNEGYMILKYEEWQVTSEEERAEDARIVEKREQGKVSAAKRWSRQLSPPEDGFEAEQAFEQAWSEWPEDGYNENRTQALEAFCTNITNSKDWGAFQAALVKRIKDYRSDIRPKAERRKYLGQFKGFCDPERWQKYLPKGFRSDGAAVKPLVPPPPPGAPPEEPFVRTPDLITQSLIDMQTEEKAS
jgi:hypothetical protein